MSFVFSILRPIFDTALLPFSGLHPLVGLTLMSLLFAVAVLLVVKATSDQVQLEAVKRRIHASLFEIRLFNDNFKAILRAVRDILRHNAHYMWLWLIPLLWLTIPMVLFLGQLQFHYGWRALEPGEKALLTVELAEGGAKPPVALEVPEGLVVETEPVWSAAEKELTWRLRAEEEGRYEIGVKMDGETITKAVEVAESGVRRRSPRRPSTDFLDQLLYPGEAPVPANAPMRAIEISYAPGDGGISGWDSELTWMLVLFVLSIVFAFALSKPMGVTI